MCVNVVYDYPINHLLVCYILTFLRLSLLLPRFNLLKEHLCAVSASPESYADDMSSNKGDTTQAEEGDKKETHELPDGTEHYVNGF